MPTLEFHAAKKIAWKSLVFAVIFAFGGVLLILAGFKPMHQVIGALVLPLAAYIIYESARALRQPQSVCTVRFDGHGFYNGRWKVRDISWNQVHAIWLGRLGNQPFLALDLAPDVTPTGIRVTLGKMFKNLPPAMIPFNDLQPGLEEAWRYLAAHQPQRLREPREY